MCLGGSKRKFLLPAAWECGPWTNPSSIGRSEAECVGAKRGSARWSPLRARNGHHAFLVRSCHRLFNIFMWPAGEWALRSRQIRDGGFGGEPRFRIMVSPRNSSGGLVARSHHTRGKTGQVAGRKTERRNRRSSSRSPTPVRNHNAPVLPEGQSWRTVSHPRDFPGESSRTQPPPPSLPRQSATTNRQWLLATELHSQRSPNSLHGSWRELGLAELGLA